MRTSQSRLSYDHHFASDDAQEILIEEMWTGPQVPPKPDDWARTEERPNRTFFGNFSLASAARRPSPAPAPASRPSEHRLPHYQTVSASLAQRRATVDLSTPQDVAPVPELHRRYSENAPTLPDFPRSRSRTGTVKRKPVPVFAIEDDLDTVEDPLWDGNANTAGRSLSFDLGHDFEERVRSLSLEEIFEGETGLGFLVQKVEPFRNEKDPRGRIGRSRSAQSTTTTKSERSSSSETDSGSADFHSFYPLPTVPYTSDLSSRTSSSRASSPPPFEPSHKSRPFALVRRRQSRPLEAHGSIIPSLATRVHASRKEEEDLMDAWMEIMVGKEEEPEKEEKPALVFQSRPRKTSAASDRSHRLETVKPRPDSIAGIAANLPPLRYAGSTTSRRSSVVSLPPLDLSEAWAPPAGVEVREDSEDGSEEFHDAKSWSSDHASTFPALEPVPESPLPSLAPPTTFATASIRFSPLFNQSSFDRYTLSATTPSQALADQLLQASNPTITAKPATSAAKRRHSRSVSLDFLANTSVPPRPPKSARRLSRPDALSTTTSLVAV
ncbi:hypothetical protein JCM11491_004253 [Sporobolomyces phaffii]